MLIYIRSIIRSVIMPEVQSHGLIWEKEMLRNVYRATQEEIDSIGYTSGVDLPSQYNRLDNCNLSIKTTCRKHSVCMADCLRLYDLLDGVNYHMVDIRYNHDDKTATKNIDSITEIDLTNKRSLLFGTVTRDQLKELDDEIKRIPKNQKRSEQSEQKYKHLLTSLRAQITKSSGKIQLNPKIDSGSQRRLQCTINYKKFQELIEENPIIVISKSISNDFRGGSITKQIPSSRRTLKKKGSLSEPPSTTDAAAAAAMSPPSPCEDPQQTSAL
jgi:hypothetical protein